jgi:uncharacterized protein (TIGR04255 family)
MQDNYVGWDVYKTEIMTVASRLQEERVVDAFNEVHFRYVSEFTGIEILQNANCLVDVSKIGLNVEGTVLALMSESGNAKILVTLMNNMRSRVNESNRISLIDIFVAEHFKIIRTAGELEEKLTLLHEKQKETFFRLISEDFLQTLKPEY